MSIKQRTYLDANATTEPLPEVIEAVTAALKQNWGNPSSQHAEGRRAKQSLRRATEQIARLTGAPESWVTWTSGGTEAINMWTFGAHPASKDKPGTIITTKAEHPAAQKSLQFLRQSSNWKIVFAKTNTLGQVSVDHVKELVQEHKSQRLSAMMIAAHNETGATQSLAELAKICQRDGIPLFFDGVQWTGKLAIEVQKTGISGWAVSFHKFGGPKGIGALISDPSCLTSPLIHGGPQQRRRRAGTENVPAIVGAGVAAEIAYERLEQRQKAWSTSLKNLKSGIQQVWPNAQFIHDPERGLPQTLLVRFPGWRGEEMVQRMDLEGIAVSTGSACASGAVTASEILQDIGWSKEDAGEMVRISLPPDVDTAATDQFLTTLAAISRDCEP